MLCETCLLYFLNPKNIYKTDNPSGIMPSNIIINIMNFKSMSLLTFLIFLIRKIHASLCYPSDQANGQLIF